MIVWLTTEANPRNPATGHDAGQTGWKLHAVEANEQQSFAEIRSYPALCGLRPKYGWGLDMFIQDKCSKCKAKI